MNRALSFGKVGLISLAVAICCSGCITASLATLGTVLGAAGSAVSTGADVYHLGKLETALFCKASDCHAAVVAAAADLGLLVKADSLDNKSEPVYEMTFLDDLKSPVGIRIQHRAAMMTLCRIDVGIFGSEPTAKLLMERIRIHLHQSPATNP